MLESCLAYPMGLDWQSLVCLNPIVVGSGSAVYSLHVSGGSTQAIISYDFLTSPIPWVETGTWKQAVSGGRNPVGLGSMYSVSILQLSSSSYEV